MLPMFDKKKMIGTIMSRRGKSPEGVEVNTEVEAPGQETDPALKSAAEDMLSAIQTKSVIDLAKALKSAYAVCESGEDETNEPEEG